MAVEAELHQRAAKEKNAQNLKSSGMKGLRELKGHLSSINYGSTSVRCSGNSWNIGLCLFLNEIEVVILECQRFECVGKAASDT